MEDLNSFLFVRVLKETLRYLFWHGNLGVTFFLFQASPFRGEEEVSSKILTLKPLKLTLLLDPPATQTNRTDEESLSFSIF